MQQVQLQQLLIRSRQQQNQQANQTPRPVPPTAMPFTPFTATGTGAANLIDPATQQQQVGDNQERLLGAGVETRNNDNNNNLLNNVGVFLNHHVPIPVYVMRTLNMFGNLRNILTNGIVHNINNNINNNQMRVINLRNNLRQINLSSIEIRPISIGGSTGGVNGTGDGSPDNSSDTRNTFQRNFEENNFQLSTDGTGPGHVGGLTAQDIVDTPSESVIADTDAEPPKSPQRIDVIHDNDVHNDANGDTAVDEAYTVQLIEKDDIVVDSAEEAKTTDPTIKGDVTNARSNEMSAELFLLRQNVTRDDDSTAQEQHTQLCTQDSSKEMCSSNKGDTGSYSGFDGGSMGNSTEMFDGRPSQCDGTPTGTPFELSHSNGSSSSNTSDNSRCIPQVSPQNRTIRDE